MKIKKVDKEKLKQFYDLCKKYKYENIGYPENAKFNYSSLFKFMKFSMNNVGDPYSSSTYPLNSLKFEREVIEFFSKLFGLPNKKSWGYVTNGGTEGNLYGVYLAREKFPTGTLYFSEDTHYSIYKILRLLKISFVIVKSQENGEIDYLDLEEKIKTNLSSPPIIFANIGTTMKGAIDNLKKIKNLLKKLNIKKSYLHCDAALSGAILPFTKNNHSFNFKSGADSISVSGHKFIGSPIPCGIVVAKKENISKITRMIDYIAAPDNTIMGSRNGITPIIIWYAIKNLGIKGFQKQIKSCLDKARYAQEQLNKRGIDAWRNDLSITVVFPKPSEKIYKKWCLANSGKWAHIVTGAHLSYKKIDELIKEMTTIKK
jgi:histidine decarboxylase